MQNNKISIPLIIGGLVLIIVFTASGILISVVSNNSQQTNTLSNTNNTTSAAVTNTSNSTQAISSAYKDGTYSASGSYDTPETVESINVQITLANGIVESLNVEQTPQSFDSQRYQSRFKQGINSLVVGKPIDSVSVSRVNGSSLTSIGFNAALDQIKNQARGQ